MHPKPTFPAIAVAAALAASAASAQDVPVDLELVLAVDVSRSVDEFERSLQRNGYIQALTDPNVIDAIASAPYGRVAMTYVEWSGPGAWQTIVDWRIVDGAESARAFAELLTVGPTTGGQYTSISSVIRHAMTLFDGNGVDGVRRVIDISGDGPNNFGGIVSAARDEAVAAGFTINGVAINDFEGTYSLADLDVYYSECVIGGPGAFVIAAKGFDAFAQAIRRKLVLEIAGLVPEVTYVAADTTLLAQTGQKYAPECDIGERIRFDQRIPSIGR